MTQVIAKLRYLHISPRKVRLVAGLIRGRNALYARTMLEQLQKRAGLPLKKLLTSSIANATHNFGLDEKNLYVSELRVDGGPMVKRMFPRSRGRADVKRKRMSHITLTLSESVSVPTPNKLMKLKS